MNAVIKYPGAKWSLARWIIDMFPPHHSYLEPFFGSGAVLFTKPRSPIETVNDLDNDVVNLFSWIREDPERLAKAIYWTPYAREVYERAWKAQYTETDPFQRAVDFYIRMMMGHGFRTTGEKVGWRNDVQGREAAYAAGYWCKTPEVIYEAAERLRGVQIEHRPAVDLIGRFNFPNVLIYADPPYMLGTRHGKQYRCEMTDEDHEELLDALKSHKGPAIISGYDSPLYNTELSGWCRAECSAIAQTSTRRREVFRRLSAYEDAEQAGQLVIFPCKVGEIVWLIDTRFFQRDKSRLPLVRCRVNEFSNDGKHTYIVLDGAERWYAVPRFRAVLIEEFGKVVFRTRDEAAAALTKKEAAE